MNKRYFSAASALLYLLCSAAFVCLIGTDITVIRLSHLEKIITAVLIFISGLGASLLRCFVCSSEKRRFHIMRRTVTLLFFVYLIIVVDFTLIDDSFGRGISNIFSRNAEQIGEYVVDNTNIVPFSTVRLFINGYKSGAVSLSACIENLFGNFCVFMPFAFFVPVVFRRINGLTRFLPAVTLTVIIIELLQLVLLTGSSDIDDLILNVTGSVAMYLLLRTKIISRFLSRITFGVWNYEK